MEIIPAEVNNLRLSVPVGIWTLGHFFIILSEFADGSLLARIFKKYFWHSQKLLNFVKLSKQYYSINTKIVWMGRTIFITSRIFRWLQLILLGSNDQTKRWENIWLLLGLRPSVTTLWQAIAMISRVHYRCGGQGGRVTWTKKTLFFNSAKNPFTENLAWRTGVQRKVLQRTGIQPTTLPLLNLLSAIVNFVFIYLYAVMNTSLWLLFSYN